MTVTAAQLCMCGHREAAHREDGTCRRTTCDCDEYIGATFGEPDDDVFHSVRNGDGGRSPGRDSGPVSGPVPPVDKATKTVSPTAAVPGPVEAGTWRAIVEDVSTGALYLVARGSEQFAARSLRTWIDANPLPLTKRGVLSQDYEYVKPNEDAPFFRGQRTGLELPK